MRWKRDDRQQPDDQPDLPAEDWLKEFRPVRPDALTAADRDAARAAAHPTPSPAREQPSQQQRSPARERPPQQQRPPARERPPQQQRSPERERSPQPERRPESAGFGGGQGGRGSPGRAWPDDDVRRPQQYRGPRAPDGSVWQAPWPGANDRGDRNARPDPAGRAEPGGRPDPAGRSEPDGRVLPSAAPSQSLPSAAGGHRPQRNEDEYLAGRILPPGTYPDSGDGHWQSRPDRRSSYRERPRPEEGYRPRPRDAYPARGYDGYPRQRDDGYPPRGEAGFAGNRGAYRAPGPGPGYPPMPDGRFAPHPAAPDPYYDGYHDRPAYDGPPYDRPGYDRPGYDRAPYDRPGYDRPAYHRPEYDRAPYDRPAYDRPGYDRPPYDRPAYDRPSHDRPAYDRPSHDRPANGSAVSDRAAQGFQRPGTDALPLPESSPERPDPASKLPAESVAELVPARNEIAVRSEHPPASGDEDEVLTSPLPVILPGATSVPRPAAVEAPRGPFEAARPSQAPIRPASVTGSVELPPAEHQTPVPPPPRALPQAAAAKLDQIKDLYLTADAIGPDALSKHFDQVSQRQAELIKEFFQRSDPGDAAAGDPRP